MKGGCKFIVLQRELATLREKTRKLYAHNLREEMAGFVCLCVPACVYVYMVCVCVPACVYVCMVCVPACVYVCFVMLRVNPWALKL